MRSLALLLLVGACSDEAPDYDEEPVNCATETRDDDFAIGLTKTGSAGTLAVKLMSATPAPPMHNIDNTWVVEVDALGAPVDGATILASPYQVDHDHPSAKTVKVQALPNGQYELTKVYFGMSGLWEITLDVSSPAGNDVVKFAFCLPT
jgi:hypothetical protein